MKYLYKFDSSSVKSISISSHDDIDLKVFTPSLRKLAIKGENVGGVENASCAIAVSNTNFWKN